MALPVWITFAYVAVVPHDWKEHGQPWPAHLRSRTNGRDDTLRSSRLVGHSPRLEIADAGPTPNAGWNRGRWLPSVQRARITLSATAREGATVASASFHIDVGLINSVQPGDAVHLALTGAGGLAISVIRGETLLAAAGAVTAVPLGNDLVARYPAELMHAVKELFREAAGVPEISLAKDFGERYSAEQPIQVLRERGPIQELELPLPEVPIEIRHEDQRLIRCRANIGLGPYRVFVIHGVCPGDPGTDECAAISRVGAGPEIATISSAQLLDGQGIEAVKW